MKDLWKLVVAVVAVLGIGLYGHQVTSKVGYTCKVEAGPFCFLWQQNTIGQVQDTFGNIMEKATKSGAGHSTD